MGFVSTHTVIGYFGAHRVRDVLAINYDLRVIFGKLRKYEKVDTCGRKGQEVHRKATYMMSSTVRWPCSCF